MREVDSVNDLNIQSYNDSVSVEQSTPRAIGGIAQDTGSLNSCLANNRTIVRHYTHHRSGHSHGEIYAPFDNSMTISAKDIQVIKDIILYLDSKSTLALGLPSNQRYLKEEGKKIEHLHPLCFIWAIVRDSEYREKLRHFRDNSAFSLKWNGFLGYSSFHDKGFGKNMERYYNHRRSEDYLHEFSEFYRALHIREEVLQPYAASKNWRGFASALLDHSSYY